MKLYRSPFAGPGMCARRVSDDDIEPLGFISTMNGGVYLSTQAPPQPKSQADREEKSKTVTRTISNNNTFFDQQPSFIFLIYSPLPSRISALSTGHPSTRPSPFRRPLTLGIPQNRTRISSNKLPCCVDQPRDD
ncbi:hypothetical protein BDZ85DRAFT_41175 [Elsinoe ampelina]|uniref:Uncharacterized protein n=1 Tax=Elsinoe ampelina TaxID=302913 RepID=A0A6A6G254_9PEZI|nr:hypothetical protein BDZ85DRAFT_41175 [Elsinoe ampelina]